MTTLKEKLKRVKAVVLCGPWSEEKRNSYMDCYAAVQWGTSMRTSTLSVGENVTGRI